MMLKNTAFNQEYSIAFNQEYSISLKQLNELMEHNRKNPQPGSDASWFPIVRAVRNALVHYSRDSESLIKFSITACLNDQTAQIPQNVRQLLLNVLSFVVNKG
jgi:hypothetical protein